MSAYSAYESYYRNQAGSGLPYFSGPASQRGYGFGSIFSGLLRSALPIFKSVGKNVGRRVLKTGMKVAGDVVQGENFKESLKNRTGEEIGTLARKLDNYPRVTSNRASRKKSTKRRRSTVAGGVAKRNRDIFN